MKLNNSFETLSELERVLTQDNEVEYSEMNYLFYTQDIEELQEEVKDLSNNKKLMKSLEIYYCSQNQTYAIIQK